MIQAVTLIPLETFSVMVLALWWRWSFLDREAFLSFDDEEKSGRAPKASHAMMAVVVFSTTAVIVPAILIYALGSWIHRGMARTTAA